MDSPDITLSEQRDTFLSFAFRRLNAFFDGELLIGEISWADDTGICLQVGLDANLGGYRGDPEIEWQDIAFTWDEWMDNTVELNQLAKTRWKEASKAQAAEAARKAEQAKRKEALEKAKTKQERAKKKAQREQATYERLKKIYEPKND